MNTPFALWGCGRGAAGALHPMVRMVCGFLFFSTVMIVPLHMISGAAAAVVITLFWCVFSGIPRAVVVKLAAASGVLFLPVLLLTPWIGYGSTADLSTAVRFLVAGRIVLRGVGCLFITIATVTTLSLTDFHRGLAALPLPGGVSALLLQLVNQTALLLEETWRVITVLRLRGAAGAAGIRVVFSFPVVWMGRILFRAERIAAAMTVRRYDSSSGTAREPTRLAWYDYAALSAAGAVLITAILLRAELRA